MNVSRRQFLKGTALGGAALVTSQLVSPLLQLTSARRQGSGQLWGALQLAEAATEDYDWEKHYWGFVVYLRRCIGCGRCVVACKTENKVPWDPDHNRTWVERYVVTEDREIFVDSPNAGRDSFSNYPENVKYQGIAIDKAFFVPKLCNQCDNPPCVQVCPVAATYMTKDGVVLVDQKRCIGCRYCIMSCPYGARYLIPRHAEVSPMGETGVADKCTWCYHRTTKGLAPACVTICPTKARLFGDLRDPNSEIRTIMAEERVGVIKPALGTKPRVYYFGLESEVW